MKILYFLTLSFLNIFTFQIVSGQRYSEMGVFGGASYYLGDINTAGQFYKPSPSVGVLYRLVLDSRQAFRSNVYYGGFQGADRDFKNDFQQNRNISFSASLLDMNVVYEFNFLPFKYSDRGTSFTPFIFGGLGYDFILQSTYNISNHFSVPFGIGLKYMISKKITVGTEWSFRKTFEDKIDGVANPGEVKQKSSLINTDWYSFAGFFISFRLFDNSECPVYQ